METTNLLKESVLSVMQRRQRAIAAKRRAPQLKRARAIAAKKLAPEETLMRRARRIARQKLRKKYAGTQGENYNTLTPAARVQVDKMIEKKLPAIERLVKRILPQVRKDERERLAKRRKAKSAGRIATSNTKSLTNNNIPIKTKVPALVREYVDLAEQLVVEQFVDFLVEADFEAYDRFIAPSVVEDIVVNELVTDQHQLDQIIEVVTVGYPINENVSLTPVASTSNKSLQYATLYHPEKLNYHVEMVKLKDGEKLEDQPAVAERLKQGYVMAGDKNATGSRTKAFMRNYRRRVDD